MSCSSGKSSVENGDHGFPSKCHCGLDVVIFTSTTKENPGRPFFRCPTKRNGHLFKWVETGVYEELVDALPKLSIMNTEINNAKSDVAVQIEELKARIEELKEDGLWSKREMKKWKLMIILCLVCLIFAVIVFVILIFSKQKLVLGY